MKFCEKKQQLKDWWKLVNATWDISGELGALYMQNGTVLSTIFPDRLQPTEGIFKAKPTDFIVPVDWGNTEPCSVTIYRNGYFDTWSDDIMNVGTKDDIKTFSCPHFDKDKPCPHECKYKAMNNESFELAERIAAVEKKRDEALALRRAAWQKFLGRKGK